jgi:hypothetical protein
MSDRPAGLSPAGFWKRYVAYSLDVSLLGILLLPLLWLFGKGALHQLSGQFQHLQLQLQQLLEQASNDDAQDPLAQATQLASDPRLAANLQGLADSMNVLALVSVAVWVLPASVYFVVLEASAWQATLGKRLIGIKVTDSQGHRIGTGRAMARFFAASLSWLTMNLGHALAAWTPERRALHDYIAGSRVENADPSRPKMPSWGWLIVAAHAAIFLLSIIAIFAVAFQAIQSMTQGI